MKLFYWGKYNMPRKYTRVDAKKRFWSKVNKTATCWLWTASTARGYGIFWNGRRKVVAHRISYELFVGFIPNELQLDHLCRVRHCVNPGHLEPVTQQENILRGEGEAAVNARKTHCKRGHPFSGDNLYMRPAYNNRRKSRACRTCHKLSERRYRKNNNKPKEVEHGEFKS